MAEEPERAPAETRAAQVTVAAAAPPRALAAVAADLARSGEPLIVVAGFREESGVPSVPVYAQRNGGWRRIGAGEWPGGSRGIVRALDAADLDGDGLPEVVALGRTGEGERELAMLAVFRLRDRDLELIADARWDGAGDDLAVSDGEGDGRREIAVIRRRDGRQLRRFALSDAGLVAGAGRVPASSRGRDTVMMTLPGPIRVEVQAASDQASALRTIQKWNAELARLRPR